MARRLKSLKVEELSFVPRGANRERAFLVMKGDTDMKHPDKARVAKALELLTGALTEINKGDKGDVEKANGMVEDALQSLGVEVAPEGGQPGGEPDATAKMAASMAEVGKGLQELAAAQKAAVPKVDAETTARVERAEKALTAVAEQVKAVTEQQSRIGKTLEAIDSRIATQAAQVRKMAGDTKSVSPDPSHASQPQGGGEGGWTPGDLNRNGSGK